MKKLIIFVLIILSGCSQNTIDQNIIGESQSQETPLEPVEQKNYVNELDCSKGDTGTFKETNADYRGSLDYTMNGKIPGPTTISLFAGENRDSIIFLYEVGLYLSDEDIDWIRENNFQDECGPYSYYGKLTELSDGVYSSSGNYIPLWNDSKDYVSEGVDFYLKHICDRLYISFDTMDNFNEEEYYYFNNNEHQELSDVPCTVY